MHSSTVEMNGGCMKIRSSSTSLLRAREDEGKLLIDASVAFPNQYSNSDVIANRAKQCISY